MFERNSYVPKIWVAVIFKLVFQQQQVWGVLSQFLCKDIEAFKALPCFHKGTYATLSTTGLLGKHKFLSIYGKGDLKIVYIF